MSTRRSNRGAKVEPATVELEKSTRAKAEVPAPSKRVRTPATVPEPALARKERSAKKEPEPAARSSRSTRQNAETAKTVAPKAVEKAKNEHTKKPVSPPKAQQKPKRNLFGFETPPKDDAVAREMLKENPRVKSKDFKPSKEKSKSGTAEAPEKTVQVPKKPSRGAAAELALSARESRSNLRAEAQVKEEEERVERKRASKEQKRADEARQAEKEASKKPSPAAPKSKLQPQASQKQQQAIQPAKISKSKLTKETKPQEVLGLGFGFSSTSRRGRPTKSRDEE